MYLFYLHYLLPLRNEQGILSEQLEENRNSLSTIIDIKHNASLRLLIRIE